MLIRELQTDDFDDLLALFEHVAAERRWIGTEPGFDRDRYRDGWRRVLRGDWGAAFVALDAGELVGYLGIHPHEEYGHVIGMLIEERARGKGIGKALLQHAEAWAREQRLPLISLLVFPHNDRAIALYRNAGFEQREYYPNDVTRQTGEVWDTILMVKDLNYDAAPFSNAQSSRARSAASCPRKPS